MTLHLYDFKRCENLQGRQLYDPELRFIRSLKALRENLPNWFRENCNTIPLEPLKSTRFLAGGHPRPWKNMMVSGRKVTASPGKKSPRKNGSPRKSYCENGSPGRSPKKSFRGNLSTVVSISLSWQLSFVVTVVTLTNDKFYTTLACKYLSFSRKKGIHLFQRF